MQALPRVTDSRVPLARKDTAGKGLIEKKDGLWEF